MQKHNPKKEDLSSQYPQALEGSVQQAKYFFFETGPDSTRELAIVFGGFEICSPDFEIKRSTYPYYIIEYVTKGKCSLEINHRPHQLKKGTLGGFTPGVPHHYKNDPQHPMEHIFVAFVGSEAADLFQKSSLASQGVIELANPGETFFLMEQILKKGLEKTEFSQSLCCHYLRALLLEQACRLASSGPSTSLAMATYRECKRYIDDHFSRLYSPRPVADACGINVRYLARLFRQFDEITPQEYIMGLKLNMAASLLLTSSRPIHQIAAQVGFEDPYNFSRNFKKFHGLSPRNYRLAHI